MNKEMSKTQKMACEHFTKAIELDDKYLKAYYQRMSLYKANEDYEDALKDCKVVAELDPARPKIHAECQELEKL
jgi:tetratricopeptide (TPR) repeat protein